MRRLFAGRPVASNDGTVAPQRTGAGSLAFAPDPAVGSSEPQRDAAKSPVALQTVLGLPIGWKATPDGLFSPLRDASPNPPGTRPCHRLAAVARSARRWRVRLRPSVPDWRSDDATVALRPVAGAPQRTSCRGRSPQHSGRSRDQKPFTSDDGLASGTPGPYRPGVLLFGASPRRNIFKPDRCYESPDSSALMVSAISTSRCASATCSPSISCPSTSVTPLHSASAASWASVIR
jgi:hypothetical protein